MLGEGGFGDVEMARQLARRHAAFGEVGKDFAADAGGEGLEDFVDHGATLL